MKMWPFKVLSYNAWGDLRCRSFKQKADAIAFLNEDPEHRELFVAARCVIAVCDCYGLDDS